MSEDDGYGLLAVGMGRRIERFGDRVVDRPVPGSTEDAGPAPGRSDLRYERGAGWTGRTEPWTIRWRGIVLELRPTAAGQVGLFPEHAALWPSLSDAAVRGQAADVLHLFAYTGATTLVVARDGARVAHVDASRPAVAWARRNAELSGLGDAPIRWFVDDVDAFVAREIRRGRRYDGVILDPPAYGHGGGRRVWRLEDALDPLLRSVAVLTGPEPSFVQLTSHTAGWTPDRLASALRRVFSATETLAGVLRVEGEGGAALELGAWARVGRS